MAKALNRYTDTVLKRGQGTFIRSNRPLTEWACTQLGFFLVGHYQGSGVRTQGNTTIKYEVETRTQFLEVFLFNEPILKLILSDWKIASIQVMFTSYYDHFGQPTLTTCERLNGLLDRLGGYQAIPSGVRVFRDESQRLTYLGKGDDKIAVGEGLADVVFIRPNVDVLDIVGDMIIHEVA